MKPLFFSSPAEMRSWLERHHAAEKELWVGFHKVGTGKPSVTWPQSVDEALCLGWIDGVRKSLGDDAYAIRFTPRKPGSNWSAVNLRKAEGLIREGRMAPAGLAAYGARDASKAPAYSFEQRKEAKLTPEQERRFAADSKAWEFFQSLAPSYRRTAIFWIASAKREETQERRLERIIRDSAAGRKVGVLTRPADRKEGQGGTGKAAPADRKTAARSPPARVTLKEKAPKEKAGNEAGRGTRRGGGVGRALGMAAKAKA